MTDINSYLLRLSNKISISKEERKKIDTSFGFLKQKIWAEFQDRLLSVEVFGSYDRDTALSPSINKGSDVDVLIIFKSKEYQPNTYLKHIKNFADNTYPRSEVYPDHPTIIIELEHIKFELIPAYWERYAIGSDDLQIPASTNNEMKWITTDPIKLKNKLVTKDTAENNMIVPMIKIFKYWNKINDKPFSPFGIEEFAIGRSYPEKDLKGCFFELINDIKSGIDMDENQKKCFNSLFENRRRLMYLEKGNILNYFEQELSSFLPIPE